MALRQPAHVTRIADQVADENGWGWKGVRWLDADEARSRIRCAGLLGASFTPHCAVLHPARVVRGLARVVEDRGVSIYEGTAATELGDRVVRTPGGSLRAAVTVQATEGYTAQLPRQRRALVPLYSLMIVTEPLHPSAWDTIGWSGRETIYDGRHLLIYAQRTADDASRSSGGRPITSARRSQTISNATPACSRSFAGYWYRSSLPWSGFG